MKMILVEAGETFRKDKKSCIRIGKSDNSSHLMVTELGAIIDRRRTFINTQDHQVATGE